MAMTMRSPLGNRSSKYFFDKRAWVAHNRGPQFQKRRAARYAWREGGTRRQLNFGRQSLLVRGLKAMTSNPLKRVLMMSGAALLIAATAGAQVQQPGAENSTGDGSAQQQQTGSGNAAGGAPGEATGSMSPTDQDRVDVQAMKDHFFIKGVLRGSMTDTRLAQLALQKSSSEDVKQFAQKVIDDSTSLSGDMSHAARQDHVHPSAKLSDKDKALIARMQSLSGEEFDRAYIQLMVRRSRGGDDAFKTEAERSELPAVRDAAGRGEPVLASHLETSRQLAAAHHVWGPKTPGPVTASNP